MNYAEFTFQVPENLKDLLITKLNTLGCLGVIENKERLIAYFPDNADVPAVRLELGLMQAVLEKAGSQNFSFTSATLPDKDWNKSWKEGFKPINVGDRFTVLPPWEQQSAGRVNLIIDPAMAFGTGHHETTRSCLVLMENLAAPGSDAKFMDVGTGTGILAIAAAKLGFKHVLAIDTDTLAVDAAIHNSALNAIPNIEVRQGSIADVTGKYDLIVANLISLVLVELSGAIASRLAPSGISILSGILDGQETEVIDAMHKAGLQHRETRRDNKWISLVVTRA